ncbi:exodeoxyribonuclease VII large subunit [Alkalibacter saccharofermentans]|uniref:Exodeoxyribonuclease 7 large subunit n=1 Tax=Alkalibacter saccharofermentans DSM 14828 TaxID=1120975 RepID=A0A1M4UFA8_9FIRM|nr:exodeoxyribonuclease VII large subunit [Alkalibacter saccharofermentans]SHE55481.1 Exodeoxyribonuclease VII large subunit [Alkalibacter saccharofermentans DSM 14828]
MRQRVLSVSKLTKYIKSIFDNDVILKNVIVEGEISNYKLHSSGHAYFSVKDDESRLNCVMFKNAAASSPSIGDGDKVILHGNISVYEKNGQYQLYVQKCEKKGLGDLYVEFEKLKSELESLGWFDPLKKKKIPMVPKKIGVVTSPTGAAIRDMISVISRRFPNVEIYIMPVSVQGREAPGEISAGIDIFNVMNEVDVVIIGRGGGSIEELWAFNERIVAESIHNSIIPVVSAVGHETDFTISDFTADLRAPTPSAAGELVVPSLAELKDKLMSFEKRLSKDMLSQLAISKEMLIRLRGNYFFSKPEMFYSGHTQTLDIMKTDLERSVMKVIDLKKTLLEGYRSELKGMNPENVLKRGYAVIKGAKGEYIGSIDQVSPGENVEIVFKDGTAISKILSKG